VPKKRTSIVALDTSVYLHCQFFTDVDWAGIAGCGKATLLIPLEVLRELDRQKDGNRSRKRRERARRVIAEINGALKHPKSEFRPGRALQVYRSLLTEEDFVAHSLDGGIPDERILAALLKFKRENPNSAVTLIARDGTMQVNASSLGLPVIEPPASIEEPDEPDEVEKELNRVKKRNAEIEALIPSLALNIPGGGQVARFSVRPFQGFGPAQREAFIEQRLAAHPPVEDRTNQPVTNIGMPYVQEAIRYTEDRERYRADLKTYLDVWEQWDDRDARTGRLQLTVENTGRVPATDVSVELTFPFDIRVQLESASPTPPSEPRPPHPPSGSSVDFLKSNADRRPYVPRFGPSADEQTRNAGVSILASAIWRPEIKKSIRGTHVTQTFKKIQQATLEKLELLVLVLPSPAHSFEIRYTLRADNMEPRSGSIHVVVEEAESPLADE